MSNGPFTDAYTQAQAAYVKDHPEAAHEPTAPLVQLMLDTEAATAKDFAEGRISKDEYDGFLAKSQIELDAFKADMHEAGLELVENFKDWAQDATGEFEALKQDHPEVFQAIESGHVTVANGADAAEFMVNVADPLVDTMFDSVDVVVDHVSDGLSGAATGLVDARNSLSSVDEAERDANIARLDAAHADWNDSFDKVHDSIAAAHDKLSEDVSHIREGIDHAHEYGAEHPEAMLVEDVSNAPDVDQHIHDDAGLADA